MTKKDPPLVDRMIPPNVSEDGKFITLDIKTTDGDIINLRYYAEGVDLLIVALEQAAQQARKNRVALGQTEPTKGFSAVAMLIVPDDFQVIQDNNTKESRLCMNRKGRYQLQIRLGDDAYRGLREVFGKDPILMDRGQKH